jgi:hypothetical protein
MVAKGSESFEFERKAVHCGGSQSDGTIQGFPYNLRGHLFT